MAKGDKLKALDELGIDKVCELIESGCSLTFIANEAGTTTAHLLRWLDAPEHPERSARAQIARKRTAELWDQKADELLEAASDPFELAKAKERAHHMRWRAKAINPGRYGDKVAVGGAADLPAIQSTVTLDAADAYKLLLEGKA